MASSAVIASIDHARTMASGGERYAPMARIVNLPEANVIAFAFLLNYPWEFLQAPFFQDLVTAPHWEAVKRCTRAAVGDAVIALIAFWAVAAGARARSWILRPTHSQLLGFVGVGLAITVVIERLATGSLGLWTYADNMPTIPILRVGIAALLQWIVLPPIVVWFVRRQLT